MGLIQSILEDDVVSCSDSEHEPTKSEIRQEETHKLIESQKLFFMSGKTFDVDYRLSLLNKLKCLFETNIEDFSNALSGDLKCSVDILKNTHFKEVEDEFQYIFEKLNEIKKTSSKVYDRPAGSVLILGTFTFPITACFVPAMAALAAGNVVVIKPSELAPRTARALTDTFDEAFLEDQLAVIPGDQWTAKELLNESWDHIFFVGPHRVAKFVLSAAAQHFTPVTLELLGRSLAFILPGADIEGAAKEIACNKWNANALLSESIDYVICSKEDDIHKLADLLNHEIVKSFGRNPEDSNAFKRVLNRQFYDKIENVLTKTEGDLLASPSIGYDNRSDYYIAPYIYKVEVGDILLKEELIGPILPIVLIEDAQEAVDYINRNGEKPANVFLYGNDEKQVKNLQFQIKTERLGVRTARNSVKYVEKNNLTAPTLRAGDLFERFSRRTLKHD
ncbi:unnamed protein product [Bursaphelenchus okinawaensis]|uniref:Aldehyde dehydrogenase domain-containing protein n=1 Tax=Bursaphelenchus okinawaensis TaxID=465554 RepID=A0A811KS11_9BILA|nr:unnamed protein product [Bursaphelenchus okinawaensis]CAG9110999.1 unnamed protein product [Bursaphelenchus okinawaensis]